MNKVVARTIPITDLSAQLIPCKDAFKVVVNNRSTGTVTVEGLPLEAGEREVFDGLHPGDVFARDFECNLESAVKAEVYVTIYKYTNDKC